jgi:hypothetical protein
MPWILMPPKGWTLGRGLVWLIAATSLLTVAIMLAHAVASGSMLSLCYALFGGFAVATWLMLRRESTETARGADALIIALMIFLLRAADPAFDWFESMWP